MAKRKVEDSPHLDNDSPVQSKVIKLNGSTDIKRQHAVIQIVAGSYDRILHGITATVRQNNEDESLNVQFVDNFLFNAHDSSIRSLALSPLPETNSTDSQTVYLATGGSDAKINLYSLAASQSSENDRLPALPSLGSGIVKENPKNRELGSLYHHGSTVSTLHFPSGSKLISASEDSTISVVRIKDLHVVSTIKVPRRKIPGQASGDSSGLGMLPSGVNDFAVHPSMKLMLSVGHGERCVRLWNLVTGKKAGVLNFDKSTLQHINEGKYSTGEGRKVRWHPSGDEYTIVFERGAIVFDADSTITRRILPRPLTKLHQIAYVNIHEAGGQILTLLTVSTEDGRVLFYSTRETAPSVNGDASEVLNDALLQGFAGGREDGVNGRIKDFQVLQLRREHSEDLDLILLTASSDGCIRVWQIMISELFSKDVGRRVGKLLGSNDIASRITCMGAYLMQDPEDDLGISDFEGLTEDDDESEDTQSDVDAVKV